jgi:hypothetical protein
VQSNLCQSSFILLPVFAAPAIMLRASICTLRSYRVVAVVVFY